MRLSCGATGDDDAGPAVPQGVLSRDVRADQVASDDIVVGTKCRAEAIDLHAVQEVAGDEISFGHTVPVCADQVEIGVGDNTDAEIIPRAAAPLRSTPM